MKKIFTVKKTLIENYLKLIKKEKIKFFDLNKLFVPKKYCLKESEILMLGKYEKMVPSIFLEKQKGCKTNACMRTKSGSEVYKLFKKGPRFHAKNPGAMITNELV